MEFLLDTMTDVMSPFTCYRDAVGLPFSLPLNIEGDFSTTAPLSSGSSVFSLACKVLSIASFLVIDGGLYLGSSADF